VKGTFHVNVLNYEWFILIYTIIFLTVGSFVPQTCSYMDNYYSCLKAITFLNTCYLSRYNVHFLINLKSCTSWTKCFSCNSMQYES